MVKREQAASRHISVVRIFICTDSFQCTTHTTGLTPPVSLPQGAVHSCFAFSSGSQSAVEWTGSVCFSSLKVPSVPWRLCHRVFAWNLAHLFPPWILLPCAIRHNFPRFHVTCESLTCFCLAGHPQPQLYFSLLPSTITFLGPFTVSNNQVASHHSSFV